MVRMPSRLLEDRIRQLCAHAVETKDGDEFAPVIQELKAALHEHSEQLRELAARKLLLRKSG